MVNSPPNNYFLASALVYLLLLFGCGAEETVNTPFDENDTTDITPVPITSQYYPISLGSRWVYRNPDGSEWTREVSGATKIGRHLYHFFSYDPPITDYQPNFRKAPAYAKISPNFVLLIRHGEVNNIAWHKIDAGKQVFGSGGEALPALCLSRTKVPWHSALNLLHIPPRPHSTWDVFEIQFSGAELSPFVSYNYKTKWTFTGNCSDYQVVETLAGVFENCLQIQYDAELHENEINNFWHVNQELERDNFYFNLQDKALHNEMNELYRRMRPHLHLETVWLAPRIGLVKIETPDGIAELIDYYIKPAQ